jgi:hypothetical protein
VRGNDATNDTEVRKKSSSRECVVAQRSEYGIWAESRWASPNLPRRDSAAANTGPCRLRAYGSLRLIFSNCDTESDTDIAMACIENHVSPFREPCRSRSDGHGNDRLRIGVETDSQVPEPCHLCYLSAKSTLHGKRPAQECKAQGRLEPRHDWAILKD